MNAEPSPPLSPNWNRLAALPFVTAGFVVAGSALVGFALPSSGSRAIDGAFVGVSTALSCLLALSLLPTLRRFAGSRAAYIVAVSLAVQGLLPFVGAVFKLGEPYIVTRWRCGTGDAALVVMAPFFAVATALVAMAVTRFAVPRIGARFAKVLRALSMVTLAGALAVTALGGAWVALRPSAGDYLARLPVVGTVPAVPADDTSVHVDVVGGARVWRQCHGEGCDLRLRAPDLARESFDGRVEHVGRSAMRVRIDARGDLAVFEGDLGSGGRAAFRLSTAAPVEVNWNSLAHVVSPPWSWLACALAGLALALSSLLRKSELAPWRSAREATLTEHGTVSFGGDVPVASVQGETTVAPGPVIVRDDAPAAHLRDMSTVRATSLRAGTLRDLRDAIALDDGGRFVLAATVAAWCALPLAVTVLAIATRS